MKNIKNIKNIINFLAVQRMRYAHASSMFNMFGIPIVIIKTIQDLLKGIGISINYPVLFIFSILGIVIMGIVLDKVGWYKAEMTYQAKRMNLLNKKDEI